MHWEPQAATTTYREDTNMTRTTIHATRRIAALALVSASGFLIGCGDAHTFSIDPGHFHYDPDSAAASLAGADLKLSRHSTLCDGAGSKALQTKVGDGLEFSSVDVSSLGAHCATSPNPGLEIDLDRASLIFDFSSVAGAGRFPSADFDGYLFQIVSPEDDLVLVAAGVDQTASNVEVASAEVSHELNQIAVNFRGASYDEGSFVKIDLWFARSQAR